MGKKVILFIIALLILAALSIAFFILREQSKKVTTQPPKIETLISGNLPIENTIKENDFKFPSSVPSISLVASLPLSEKEALEVGTKLGFTNLPNTSPDVYRGTTYIWGGRKSLVIYSKTNEIVFTEDVELPVPNKQISEEEIIKIAQGFLISNSLFSEDELYFSFFSFLKTEPGSPHGVQQAEKKDASFYAVNFSAVKSDYKILSLNPDLSDISVWVLPDGTVAKAEVKINTTAVPSGGDYRLKNYQEFIDSIKEASLIRLENDEIPLYGFNPKDIKKITVSQIEFAYLNTRESSILVPVFLLKGSAELSSGDSVTAELYLSATSSQE